MQITFNKTQIYLGLLLILGILPVLQISGFTIPLQYAFLPIFVYLLLFIFLGRIKIPKFGKLLIIIWILIISEVIFTGILSPLFILGNLKITMDSLQYVVRMLFFVSFIVFFYNSNIDAEKFYKNFLNILLLGMCVAIFQFFNFGPLSEIFKKLYSFTDHHYYLMDLSNLSSKRISGVASHSTANGGLTAFVFIMLASFYFLHKRKILYSFIGIALVLFNIVVAQARMGYLTIVFAVVVFYFVFNIALKKGIKPTVYLALISGSVYWLTSILYYKGNEFVVKAVMRWGALEEQINQGGNRYGQVTEALSLMKNPWDYMFGISRGVENAVEGLYIEVEPINIFVLYGGFGFALQYSLVVILLIYFWRNIKVVNQYPILLTMVVASFITLLSYQFFSLAYFFFREIRIGLFPWILMGATIGLVERLKKNPQSFENIKREVKVSPRKKRRRIVW